MKLVLNKKKLKNLSKDNNILPESMTPQVAGGTNHFDSYYCDTDTNPGTWPGPTGNCTIPDVTDLCNQSNNCGPSEHSGCCTTVTIP